MTGDSCKPTENSVCIATLRFLQVQKQTARGEEESGVDQERIRVALLTDAGQRAMAGMNDGFIGQLH